MIRQRNPHRSGHGLGEVPPSGRSYRNPRYTGRQVWNRQRKDEVLIDVNDVALGHTPRMRWNDPGKWVYSDAIAHPLLIGDEDFLAAQRTVEARMFPLTTRKPRQTRHPYLLLGRLYCGICERRMHGTWNNNQAYYRCLLARPHARGRRQHAHPRSVCLPETVILATLDAWLGRQPGSCQLGEILGSPAGRQTAVPADLGYKHRADLYAKLGLRVTTIVTARTRTSRSENAESLPGCRPLKDDVGPLL